MRIRFLAASAAAAILIAAGVGDPAWAASASMQREIDAIIAAHPAGAPQQTAPNAISWYGGKVQLVYPVPVSPRFAAGTDSSSGSQLLAATCDSGYFCFFEHASFGGRKIQLTGCDGIPGNLTNYGFNDLTSSWWNNTGYNPVNVYRDINAVGLLWSESAFTKVGYVGDANNDKASSLNCWS